MDDISGNNPGLRSNLARWTILSVAALFAAFSFYQIFSYTFVSFVVIAVSSIVASLIGKYEMSVPGTEIKFRPKVVLAFWGAMWLGVGGAAILGSLASASKKESASKYTMNDALRIAPDTIAAFLGALAFQVSLIYYAGSKPAAIGGFNIPNEVVAASFLMAITHFAVSLALAAIINTTTDVEHRVKDLPVQQIAKGYFTTLSATIVLFLVFNHFGIEFGLVILPLVIFADIAFKIHIRSLELKTRQISEASRVHMATVEALATAIDARDQVGIGHVRRTQIYAVGIGNVMGLSDDEINALRTGALLHDIGKLAVPDHILNKPGRLTPGEMEKTKIHSSVGASILEKVGFPYPVVPIVKYHHECWDGSGYPEGLRGNNIPITARILAIADTFDTLRGARPYRHAVPRDEACDFLRSRAGSQFDPTIVDLFLRNLRIFENEIDAQGLTYEKTIEGPAVGSIVLDESATPNYVEQIKRANHEVFTLYSLARDFSGSLNLDETLSLFTRKIAEFIPFDTSVVYLLDESGETATAAYAHGLNRSVLSNKQIKLGEGATGYALKKLRPVENVDPALDFAFSDT
ncbi:MAG TPA: HD-GYP domain-containing protein, partial [Pyrinomonadaceae bacterium]|nr:HD-GYP domain-containing protein [Pyrinomonadaceae bacterium]